MWKSRWPCWASVPHKPTVSADVQQHSNQPTKNWTVLASCLDWTGLPPRTTGENVFLFHFLYWIPPPHGIMLSGLRLLASHRSPFSILALLQIYIWILIAVPVRQSKLDSSKREEQCARLRSVSESRTVCTQIFSLSFLTFRQLLDGIRHSQLLHTRSIRKTRRKKDGS